LSVAVSLPIGCVVAVGVLADEQVLAVVATDLVVAGTATRPSLPGRHR
jgi:hypothetical protein